MHGLLATHLLPFPPDTGGKIVAWQTLTCLSQLGPVDLCAFMPPWGHPGAEPPLRQYARSLHVHPLNRAMIATGLPLSIVRGLPYYVMRDYSRAMSRSIRRLLMGDLDVAVADSLHMAPYLADVPVPKILQEHNAESYLVREFFGRHRRLVTGWIRTKELHNLERFERDHCNAFDAVVTLSSVDGQRLRDLGVRVPIVVIPPAVAPVEPADGDEGREAVGHLGTLHWPPVADGLRWYLREVHSQVRRGSPGVRTIVAGHRPPPDIVALHGKDGIDVMGRVADPDRVYRCLTVFIVPLRVGGGVRVKILEALARGLAVVSTSAGCEGLGLIPGRHLLVADDPRDFAEAVLTLLRDPSLRSQLGRAGRTYVLERFSLARRCAALAALVRAVTRGTLSDEEIESNPSGARPALCP